MDFPFGSGIDVIRFLQSAGWLEAPMRFFTFLGSEEFFLLILPVMYWCVDAGLGMRIGFILLFSHITNGMVKLALQSPRPYWVDPQIGALSSETTFGAPSGHAQHATAIWGMAGAHFRSNAIWWLAGILIFLIGLSRMYLAVHYPTDVILGWLIGGLLLAAFVSLWQPVASWLKRRTLTQQVLLSLAAPAFLLLCSGLLSYGLRLYVLPADWMTNAARAGGDLPAPLSLEGTLTSAGTMSGLGLGLIWVQRRGGYQPSGPLWERLACFVVGVFGVAILYFGLKLLVPSDDSLLGSAWRFMRYALLGLWIAGGAPLAFTRLGLTGQRPRPVEVASTTA